jgi:hypothetical protein
MGVARPGEVYAYWVEGEKHGKLDPSKLLYCLQWLHLAYPRDFHLQLTTDLDRLRHPDVARRTAQARSASAGRAAARRPCSRIGGRKQACQTHIIPKSLSSLLFARPPG